MSRWRLFIIQNKIKFMKNCCRRLPFWIVYQRFNKLIFVARDRICVYNLLPMFFKTTLGTVTVNLLLVIYLYCPLHYPTNNFSHPAYSFFKQLD